MLNLIALALQHTCGDKFTLSHEIYLISVSMPGRACVVYQRGAMVARTSLRVPSAVLLVSDNSLGRLLGRNNGGQFAAIENAHPALQPQMHAMVEYSKNRSVCRRQLMHQHVVGANFAPALHGAGTVVKLWQDHLTCC